MKQRDWMLVPSRRCLGVSTDLQMQLIIWRPEETTLN